VATDIFALPERLAAKTDPVLIGADVAHFAAVAACLEQRISDLTTRLDELRRAPGRSGRGALDRDLEIHRLSAQLRLLRRFGLDVCLGRMVRSGDPEPTWVGRIGLTTRDGRQLLLDWRTPAAEPYFAATQARPMGLASRRRYRWVDGRIRDYWDEVLTPGDGHDHLALDEDSAFIASLGTSRSSRMRDVLATIQADQDAIIRAGSHGALVVDGGPGTGKTVVALHRAAYLLYADPRLNGHGGGLLFVGPHQPYLAYVSDVLPSLGEEGVLTCTLRDLVPEAAAAVAEPNPEVAALKASAELLKAVEPAVALYEEPPTTGMTVETDWGDGYLSAADWAEAFEAPDPGTPHNEARSQVWESLLDILVDSVDDPEVPVGQLRRALSQHEELWETFRRAWPVLEAPDLVGDLWAVPAYLRRCALWLDAGELQVLKRPEGSPWTTSDLPLLDAMRQRLGDPEAFRRHQRRSAAIEADRAYMDDVVEDLLTANDDPESPLPLLRRESLRAALVDEAGLPTLERDLLAGPFAHIIVDEAQELTDAEWQQLLSRCPSRSFTIVGDRAQARRGFTESWRERLGRVGFDRIDQSTLTINYRTPEEVMAEAGSIIRAVLPDANLPTSIRRSGVPVRYGSKAELAATVDQWLAGNPEGTACVIGDPGFTGTDRVRSLRPETAKGLEFDLVVLVDPDGFGSAVGAAVDRYVAMTRTTQQLVVLSG
jgi:hypothetical protein